MKLKRNDSTPEGRDFWTYVDSVVKEVKTWPKWMRGDQDEMGYKAQEPPSPKNSRSGSASLNGR
jgi:hypothetical protein